MVAEHRSQFRYHIPRCRVLSSEGPGTRSQGSKTRSQVSRYVVMMSRNDVMMSRYTLPGWWYDVPRIRLQNHYLAPRARGRRNDQVARSSEPASLSVITAPDPHECAGQRLIENMAVAVSGRLAEDEALMITFGLQRGGGAAACHDPVVVSLLGVFRAQVDFRDVSENAQGFCLGRLDQFLA